MSTTEQVAPTSLLRPRPSRQAPTFHRLRVHDVERLTDDAVAVSFDVPGELAAAYDFAAGQSLTLRRRLDGEEHRRTYSICAAAGDRPRIGVREIPGGLFSQWLVHEVRPGDEVEVQTPHGSFRADPTVAGRHLCIAAGSGITPMLSIAATVLGNPDSTVTLVYGNRTTGSVMFADELADLKNRHGARLQLVHVRSREPRDVELFSGRLDGARLRRLLDLLVPVHEVDDVWLCGPFAMTQEAREVLDELGVDPARVHFELFYVDEPPPELTFARHVPHTPPLQANGRSLRISWAESRMDLPRSMGEVVVRPSRVTVTSLVTPSTTRSACRSWGGGSST